MIEAGSRRRALPAPPHVVVESLSAAVRNGGRSPLEPGPDAVRQWLHLLRDEQLPTVVDLAPGLVVWSSLWPKQPEALIRFELAPERSGGTDLRWTLLVDVLPDASRLGHYRRRINELIHANLRYSYGQ
ncbi:MAG: hypothetical protein L0H64_09880 [Pseudonocardia sp.]|nr:hypothetical protein [Pseudonocardia sp.]